MCALGCRCRRVSLNLANKLLPDSAPLTLGARSGSTTRIAGLVGVNG